MAELNGTISDEERITQLDSIPALTKPAVPADSAAAAPAKATAKPAKK